MEDLLSYIIPNWGIVDVTIEDPSMEEIITHIYTRSGRLDGAQHEAGCREEELMSQEPAIDGRAQGGKET
jgi:hypothetical protein